jgi:hypothetical protein
MDGESDRGIRPEAEDGGGRERKGTRRWSKMTYDRCDDVTFRIHPILIAIAHAMMLVLWSMATGIGSGYLALRPNVGEGEKELATHP